MRTSSSSSTTARISGPAGVISPHILCPIAPMRDTTGSWRLHAFATGVLIHAVWMCGPQVSLARAQDAVMVEVDQTMEDYRLDSHIPDMVWENVQAGRWIHQQAAA